MVAEIGIGIAWPAGRLSRQARGDALKVRTEPACPTRALSCLALAEPTCHVRAKVPAMESRPPTSSSAPSGSPSRSLASAAVLVAILGLVLAFLFRDSFDSKLALFANDGPFGLVASRVNSMPEGFLRIWLDLNWLGFNGVSRPTTLSFLLLTILGAHGFINWVPAFASLFLGLSVYAFCRTAGFRPAVGVLAGLGGALNSDFFSYGCWGLPTLTFSVAWMFLALAALQWKPVPVWLRAALAGTALGQSLMEGFDNGAIFSLYIAAAAVATAWFTNGPGVRRLANGAATTAGIAIASAIIASHVLLGLVQSYFVSSPQGQQTIESPAAKWSFTTQWSLPPKESLRSLIPGLYGYRMDTHGGGQYWGTVGSDPDWDDYWASPRRDPAKRPAKTIRFSGAGHYAGVLVVLMAAFAVTQSFRRTSPQTGPGSPHGGSVLTDEERKWVWFWAGTALLSLLFSFGRFAPFYHLVYALPYFNTIRNPVKFLHPFNVALVILCAYGLQALWRGWIERPTARAGGLAEAISAWWRTAAPRERRWVVATTVLVGASVMAWLIYGASRDKLLLHLAEVGFTQPEALAIARFSINEVGLFALLLAVSVGLVLVCLSGWLSGSRARWAAISLGALLALDLARANAPWIIHYNWRDRLATNPLFDQLRANPHLGRVTGRMPFSLAGQAGQALEAIASVYAVEWQQHQFPYFEIQTYEMVQLPRPPADYTAFRTALYGKPLKEWELTNTRYLLALAPLVDLLNQQLDPVDRRFRLHTAFELSQTPAGTFLVRTNMEGPFGLIEFTGALPRAMLFDRWRSDVADSTALEMLPSTNFNPHAEVLISEQIPAPAVTTSSQPAGTANYRSYTPTRFVIDTEARTPCVLLLNDRHDPNWRVTVDGKEQPLLRANYIMRGVYLEPGRHTVEFTFRPPIRTLVFSLVALASAGALFGLALRISSKQTLPQTPLASKATGGPGATMKP